MFLRSSFHQGSALSQEPAELQSPKSKGGRSRARAIPFVHDHIFCIYEIKGIITRALRTTACTFQEYHRRAARSTRGRGSRLQPHLASSGFGLSEQQPRYDRNTSVRQNGAVALALIPVSHTQTRARDKATNRHGCRETRTDDLSRPYHQELSRAWPTDGA